MEENTCQKFRLKNIDETTNYLIEEIIQNELISKNHKKAFTFLNCVEHILILCPTIPEYVSISAFTSLVGILIEITSSAVGLKICVITAAIKISKQVNN